MADQTADIFVETETIDLGSPAARRHLVDGWSPIDERWAQREDETFVWARGSQASIRFFQIESQPHRLRIRARPHVVGETPVVSTLFLRHNGVTLPTSVDVLAGWQDYVVPLPTRFLSVGANELSLEFDRPPDDERSTGTSLRFAVDSIRFFDPTVTALPRLEPPGVDGV